MEYIDYNKSNDEIFLRAALLDFYQLDGYDWSLSEKNIDVVIDNIHKSISNKKDILKIISEKLSPIGIIYFGKSDVNPSEVMIKFLYLISSKRNVGIGESIMKEFYRMMKDINVTKINLIVTKNNHHAVSFYTKLGFNICRYQMHLNLKY